MDTEWSDNLNSRGKRILENKNNFSPGALPNKPPPAGFAPNAGAGAGLPKRAAAGATKFDTIAQQTRPSENSCA